jgi:hypothetical protein
MKVLAQGFSELYVCGGVQLSSQFAGMGVSSEPASALSPSANPSQNEQPEAPVPNQPSRPRPAAAGTLIGGRRRAGNRPRPKAASRARPDEEQPSGAPDL